MKYACIILCSLLLFGCKQHNQPVTGITTPAPLPPKGPPPPPPMPNSKYIQHPNPGDTTCINEIAHAKKDIEQGKLCLCIYPMESRVKHWSELSRLCSKQGLVARTIASSCIIYEGQTQHCYEAYMDSVVNARYGNTLKEKLVKQATDMDIAPTDTVDMADCDGKEQEIDELIMDTTFFLKLDNNLLGKLKEEYAGRGISMIVSFYVDTLGHASGYFNHYDYAKGWDKNYMYKDQLLKACTAALVKIKTWPIGKVHGKKHVTECNAELVFKYAKRDS